MLETKVSAKMTATAIAPKLQLITGVLLLIGCVPRYVCGQQASFCSNGFESSLSSGVARNGRQYIFPFINFTCHGNVTLWSFFARANNNEQSTLYPEFQIWRPDRTGSSYTKVAHTNISSDSELVGSFTANGIDELYTHNISVSGPMTFQPGDIVGVYTPRGGNSNPRSRLSLRFNTQPNGPDRYFISLSGTNPLPSTFQLSGSGVSTNTADLPEISAQVVIFETTSFGVSSTTTTVTVIERTSTFSISKKLLNLKTTSFGVSSTTTTVTVIERTSTFSISTVTPSTSTGVITLQAASSTNGFSPSNSRTSYIGTTIITSTSVIVSSTTSSPESPKQQLALTIGVAAGVCLVVVLIVIILIVTLCLSVYFRLRQREVKINDPPPVIQNNQAYGFIHRITTRNKDKESSNQLPNEVVQKNPAYSIHSTARINNGVCTQLKNDTYEMSPGHYDYVYAHGLPATTTNSSGPQAKDSCLDEVYDEIHATSCTCRPGSHEYV